MPVRRKLMKSDTPGYAARFLRHRLPRLCVALFASSPSELMEKIEHAANENSLLELRLDYLSQACSAIAKAQGIRRIPPGHPLDRNLKKGAKRRKVRRNLGSAA